MAAALNHMAIEPGFEISDLDQAPGAEFEAWQITVGDRGVKARSANSRQARGLGGRYSERARVRAFSLHDLVAL